MWLVAHNRCWTTDHLAKRGSPHPGHCPLCDQADETIGHLLTSCVFSRQVWFSILHKVAAYRTSPHQHDNNSFDAWWTSTNSGVDDQTKKDLNSIIILGAWSIWNHHNRCMFDGIQSSLISSVLVLVKDEFVLWSLPEPVNNA